MSDNESTPAANVSRFKILLIPVLALTLLGVLFWPSAQDPPVAARRAALPVFAAAGASSPATSASRAQAWRAIDTTKAAAFNPFARPAGIDALFHTAAVAANAATAAPTLEPTPIPRQPAAPLNVQAVFQASGTSAALIDGQIVHAGDILQDGTKVVSITPEGVITDRGPDGGQLQ